MIDERTPDELRAALAKVTAERDAAEEKAAEGRFRRGRLVNARDDARARQANAEAEVARLRAALEPFALAGNNLHELWPDTARVGAMFANTSPTFMPTAGDFRRAAAILRGDS